MWDNQHHAAAQRYAERRQQEDAAPRLLTQVPALKSLVLDIQERSGGWPSPDPAGSHVRHIVVSTAPALFLIMCHDPACRDGGHDITSAVMRALRAGQTTFTGEDRCTGRLGSADCQRHIRFAATATYEGTPSGNHTP
ncbi:MAG TPA: hypothetical protein VM686_39235 [Polyangiaceae bacterium]|nr:hypothetical protein [Polyangiaceae bacterium]